MVRYCQDVFSTRSVSLCDCIGDTNLGYKATKQEMGQTDSTGEDETVCTSYITADRAGMNMPAWRRVHTVAPRKWRKRGLYTHIVDGLL